MATPGRVAPASGAPIELAVYGDSLTPTPDYVLQGDLSGYRVTSHAAMGSHMCGVGGRSRDADGRNWPKIVEDIRRGVDAIVLQYQGWQNYTFACGGRMDAFPWPTWKVQDPSKKWRVYLDLFRTEIERAGDRTHLFVMLSIPSPADLPSWAIPQRIIDHGTRVMAGRHPRQITAVSARDLFSDAEGRWTGTAPCITQERAAGFCGLDGRVRLRGDDRIHLACPGSPALVCDRPSPAGTRYRLRLFGVLNAHFAAHPVTTDPGG